MTPNYYVDQSTKICRSCLETLSNCEECEDQDRCSLCVNSSFFLDTNSKCYACEKAINRCATCERESNVSVRCVSCLQEYFLTVNNSCESCLFFFQHCFKCSNASVCELCEVGYAIADGECSLCS